MVEPPLNIGARVRLEAHTATVKYVGEVAQQSGIWVGLEWDDASRGKNDGSASGKQYFTCAERSGSFIRLQKFVGVADLGQTLFQALHDRYRGGEGGPEDIDISIRTISRKQMPVKLVGRAKIHARQGVLRSLQAANLVAASVCRVVSPSPSTTAPLLGKAMAVKVS